MSYRDVWRKKAEVRGNSSSNSFYDSTAEFFTQNFKDDGSYREAELIDENMNSTSIDIRVTNIDATTYKKRIYLLPNAEVSVGDYLYFDENYYLITEIERNLVSPRCTVKYCNETLRTNEWELPCVAEGESYGVKMTATNEVLLETDTKVKISVGKNIISRTIEPDFRFILGFSKFGVYKVGDITVYSKGLFLYTSKKDKYYDELDDAEKGIAWQKHELKEVPILNGSDRIRVDNTYEYTIDKNEKFNFTYDDDLVEEVNRTDNSITLKCKKPNGAFKLIAESSKTRYEKNILTVR